MISWKYIKEDFFSSITLFGLPVFYLAVILALLRLYPPAGWQASLDYGGGGNSLSGH
jgi:hypothetical protein